MPAPAVIPAPIAYIKVVAVKTLVVRILGGAKRKIREGLLLGVPLFSGRGWLFLVEWIDFFCNCTVNKLECLKQASCMNTLAWNTEKRQQSSYWGFDGFLLAAMINGNSWGDWYLVVRGEILGLNKDQLQRKRFTRMFSLIKNESWGIEDDQIPS